MLANAGSKMAIKAKAEAKATATAATKAETAPTAAAETTTKKLDSMLSDIKDDIKDMQMSHNDERGPAWAQGMAKDEQIFVLGKAQGSQDCSDSGISIASNQMSCYRKQWKKVKKKLTGKRSRN